MLALSEIMLPNEVWQHCDGEMLALSEKMSPSEARRHRESKWSGRQDLKPLPVEGWRKPNTN